MTRRLQVIGALILLAGLLTAAPARAQDPQAFVAALGNQAIQVLGPSYSSIILVLALLSWTYLARIVRAQVLSIKEKEFIEAARASGASTNRIMVRHIFFSFIFGTDMFCIAWE